MRDGGRHERTDGAVGRVMVMIGRRIMVIVVWMDRVGVGRVRRLRRVQRRARKLHKQQREHGGGHEAWAAAGSAGR